MLRKCESAGFQRWGEEQTCYTMCKTGSPVVAQRCNLQFPSSFWQWSLKNSKEIKVLFAESDSNLSSNSSQEKVTNSSLGMLAQSPSLWVSQLGSLQAGCMTAPLDLCLLLRIQYYTEALALLRCSNYCSIHLSFRIWGGFFSFRTNDLWY